MLGRSTNEGFKNLYRTFWLSVTAITVLFLTILSSIVTVGIIVTADTAFKSLDKKISLSVFLDEGANEVQISEFALFLDQSSLVREYTFMSRDEARDNILSQSEGDAQTEIEESLEYLDENPFLDSFSIVATDTDLYSELEQSIQDSVYNNYIDSIQTKDDVINSFNNFYSIANIIGIVVVIIFVLISITVLMNVLKISIFHFKDEIETMRLMGATNGYISGPFVAQGTLFGFIASVLVLIAIVPVLLSYVIPEIITFLELTPGSEVNELEIKLIGAIVITTFSTILLSAIAAKFATNRYLKL